MLHEGRCSLKADRSAEQSADNICFVISRSGTELCQLAHAVILQLTLHAQQSM